MSNRAYEERIERAARAAAGDENTFAYSRLELIQSMTAESLSTYMANEMSKIIPEVYELLDQPEFWQQWLSERPYVEDGEEI